MTTPLSLTSQSRSWIARAGFAALLVPIVLAGASPAAADSAAAAGMHRQVTVRYGDLDLASSEGAAVLYQRLHKAARTVCGASEIYERRDLQRVYAHRECYERVLSATVQKVSHPILAALHRARWNSDRTA
jgi:UrcA family protein